jgi:predicted HTH transcriptional regulator
MDAAQLQDIIVSGETSKVQFKEKFDKTDSIAAEMIALSNTLGGIIIFGVEDKKGILVGLDYEELQMTGNKIAQTASDSVTPPIYPITEVITLDEKKFLVAHIQEGSAKPYKNNNGTIWVKQGADKRRLTDNNEQMRLFQNSGLLHFDEMTIPGTSFADLEPLRIKEYLELIKKDTDIDTIEINETLARNMSALKDGKVTLGGLLYFAKHPERHCPIFCIKAVSFVGNNIGGSEYRNSRDIEGTIPHMYEKAMDFVLSNIRHLQADQDFNSVGIPEISPAALSEIVQNALIHRDYSKNAAIRLLIFDNRIEIISPGSLPNSLTVEGIKLGNAAVRNNLIASIGSKLIPYRGLGSGIARILLNQPDTEFENDSYGEQFIVRVPRKANVQ